MSDPLVVADDAMACLELATIARGIVVLDAMAKRAETDIVASRTVSPGRFLIVLSGRVAEIEEAMDAALEVAAEDRVDDVIIRDPARGLADALASRLETGFDESLLIVETAAISSALKVADRTLKETEARMLELRLGAGLSGKGVFTLTGALHMMEAARAVVESNLVATQLVRVELIAQPHPDLPEHLLGAEPTTARGPK